MFVIAIISQNACIQNESKTILDTDSLDLFGAICI